MSLVHRLFRCLLILAVVGCGLSAGEGTGTGLSAAYFANETLSGAPAVTRVDAQVNFAWSGGAPASGMPVDSFSARWDGEIEALNSESLTLIARTDDGVRLWLDGQLVIDQWVLRGAADSSYTFTAVAGQRYRIRMEYYEHFGSAVAQLLWQSASITRSAIPMNWLYPTLPVALPSGMGTGLLARYYANETLSGAPVLSRTDARVDFGWSGGSPDGGVPVDSFSARWDGEIEARVSEPLTIIARTDDGVRVWINGQVVIDAWVLRSAADSTYTFSAEAGQRYRIRMEYYEHTGAAVARLWWQSANEPKGPIPTSQLYPTDPVDPPNGTGTGLLASYFANETLSGSPVLSRTEARVDHSWGSGSPGAGVPVDVFSARWLGEIEPRTSEPLTLIARTDDGVRLWIDGQLVIDQWILRGAADSTYTFSAEAGRRYSIRMEYFEHLGSAVAKLWWRSASEPKAPIPTSQLYPTEPAVPPAGTGTGLFATYFANETLSGDPILSRLEARVDHSWGAGSPGSPVPVDVFSARWEGEIEPRVSEPLTIIARTDDGVRVWLNDAPVIDAWILRGAADSTYTFPAIAGQRYRIRMEYFEHLGSAVAKLWWQSANEPKGPIPTSQLYPITGTPTTPTIAFASPGTTVAETVGSTPVAVTLSQPAATAVTVTIQSSGSGATAPATVTIPAGGTTASVPVTISDDPRFGPDRQVTLSLVNPVGADLGLVTSHVLTIQNTDAAPTIAFTAPTSFNLEQSGTASVIVRLSAVSAQTTTVTVGLTGNAKAGSDYQAPSATLQIPADTFEGTIFIPLLADSTPEQDETIIVTLSAPVGATLSNPSVHTITLSDGNLAPVIANGPTPAVNPVTGTSVSLSFVATDDGGGANLSFTWSTVGSVPAPVSFAPATGSVGTTSTTTATFSAPGTYPIQVQVHDAYDLTATAQSIITVQSTPALITVAPATATVSVLGTQAFTATGVNQFGAALAQPLPVTWSVAGGGSIATNGVFTAGTTAGGPFTVTATLPSALGVAAVTVIDNAPTLVQGPTATVNAAGTGLILSALAADDGGETALSYRWSIEGSAPGIVSFAANDSNAAKNTTATVSAAGTYTLRLTVTDSAGQAIPVTTPVTVAQRLSALAIAPDTVSLTTGAEFDFTLTGRDQFDAVMTSIPSPMWSITGGGIITPTVTGAHLVAGSEAGGPFTVTVVSGAIQATATVTIVPPTGQAQTITFAPLPAKTYGDAAFTLTATASSGLPVSYSSSDPAIASINGANVTMLKGGTVTITASQAGDVQWNAATSVPQELTIAKAAQTITFAALPTKVVSDAPFTLTGTATSGLPLSYASSDPSVASVSGVTVTIHAVGTTIISAEQPGNDLWQAAVSVPQVLTITAVPKQPQSIAFTGFPTRTVGDAPFTLTGTASSGLPVGYTSSDTAVATVEGDTVTILAAGTTTITANQPGDGVYDAAVPVEHGLVVIDRPAPVVSYVTSNLAKATLLGTPPPGNAVTGIEVSIIDPVYVISFVGEVSGDVFRVEVDNAVPAVPQVTLALAFRFGTAIGPQTQVTVPFGTIGGGGGDYEEGTPDGIPPFPPKVTLVIESGLTGKQQETINGESLHFTQNDTVVVRVHTSGSYSPISSITVSSSDGQTIPVVNGIATLPTPIEGVWELSAMAVATNEWGTATGFTTDETKLVVDRTGPRLIHVLPSRYWPEDSDQQSDPPPTFPLRHSLGEERMLVRLNGKDDGSNKPLRDQGLNVFDHAGYSGEAEVDDLSGLRTDVIQSGEAKDRQGFPTDITLTVRAPVNQERGDPQTVLLTGFSGLADSVEYSGILENNRRGFHRLAVTLEDRAGNRLESHDEYDVWVQTRPPEATFATRMGPSGYAMEADLTQLSPARFIFTSADIEEAWQDSRDDEHRLQLLTKSSNQPRLWLLKTPTVVPAEDSVSVSVILRDRAGGISDPISVSVSRQILHEDVTPSFSEGPMAWFARESSYDYETPLFRDGGASPTDEFLWSIPDNDRLTIQMGTHRGNVEGTFTLVQDGEIPYDPANPEYGGYPVYKVTGVQVAGNKGYVEHTHLNVSPFDVGEGEQRRFAPAVITIPPSWKKDPPSVDIRIRDQGIVPVRQLGALEGTITLSGVKTPSQPDGIFDLMQGTDNNSITAQVDLRRTVDDPAAGPVLPGQPIPQTTAANPGFNRVEYVVSAGQSGSSGYVQVTPYSGNAAYRWMNLIRLSPDVVATGTTTTIRIEAGFLTEEIGVADFAADSGDYVSFFFGGSNITESRSDYEAHKNDEVRPTNRISIVDQRLVMVGESNAPQGSVQALELDLVIGPDVAIGLVDVDVNFGAVKAYPDDLSQAHGASNDNGNAHRMKEALVLCRLKVNPITLWQLEDKQYSLRIAGRESASNSPADQATVWLDIALPHLSDAEAKEKVRNWKLTWEQGPISYLLQQGTGAFTTLAHGNKVPVDEGFVRVLGGQVPSAPFEDDIETQDYHIIETDFKDSYGDPLQVIGYVTVQGRVNELELGTADFHQAPWGGMTLFGNRGTLRFIDEGPKPDLAPTAESGQQPPAGTAYGRSTLFEIKADPALMASDGNPAAELLAWSDGAWEVSGRMPGDTIIQISPLIDGNPVGPALEIALPIEIPTVAEPGPFQVQIARANNQVRMKYALGQIADLFEAPTPIPPVKGGTNGNWRWPEPWLTAGAVDGTQPRNTTTFELDGVAEMGMFLLAQIAPVREGGPAWHYPMSGSDGEFNSIFQLPPTTSGIEANHDLGYVTLAKIWSLDTKANDAWVAERLRNTGPPQDLWKRWWKRYSADGAIVRRENLEEQGRRLMEVRMRQIMDQVTLARLKRWFTLAWDARNPNQLAVPPQAQAVSDGVVNEGLVMLGRPTSGSNLTITIDRDLFQWLGDAIGWTNPLSRLLDTPVTPDWAIGHPFTEELLRHMMDERLAAAAGIVEHLKGKQCLPGKPGFPVRLANDTNVLGDGTGDIHLANLPLMVDLITRDDGRPDEVVFSLHPDNVRRLPGTDGRTVRDVFIDLAGYEYERLIVGPTNTSPETRITGEVVLAYDDSLFGIDDPYLYVGRWDTPNNLVAETDYVRVRASDAHGAALLRALREVSYLRKMLDDRQALAAAETLRQDSPISYFIFTIGDFISPVGEVYRAAWGEEVLTGKKLENGDRALSAAFAALEIIPGVVSLAGRVATALSRGLRASRRTIGQDLARTAAQNTAGTADDRVQDAVNDFARDGVESGVQAGARRPAGFVRAADGVFEGAERFSKFMDMNVVDILKRHVGLGRIGHQIMAKKGAQAPIATAAYSAANAAKRLTPPVWLARGQGGTRLTGRTADEAIAATDDVSALDEALREYRRLHGDDACAELVEEFQKAACFPAGTPVALADGSWRAIESIRVGQAVLSRADDAPAGLAQAAPVERVMVRTVTRLATLTLATVDGTRQVVATPEHPVYVRDRGWTELHDLVPDDRLVGGVAGAVVSVSITDLSEPVAVYNFAVAGLHTYHVGMSGGTEPALLWVHNRCEWASLAEEKIRRMYGGPTANRAGMTKADLVKEMIRIRTALEARAKKLSGSKSSKLAWRATPDPKKVDAMTDEQALKAINGPGRSKNLRQRLLTLFEIDNFSGVDAHHLIPKDACKAHAKFLAKLGFDIDNPRNGTLLASEALKGPRQAGRKQAVHADGHPGYIQALTAKIDSLSKEFQQQVGGIPHPAGSAAYDAAYQKVVMDMQTKIHEMQNKCRDALQKGKPLMGDTTTVKTQWDNFLK